MAITRRNSLAAGAAGIGLAIAGATPRSAMAAPPRTRRLRIAHLTDIHLQPELQAARGFTACLAHAQSRPAGDAQEVLGRDAADMIITGGDTIMDAFEADMARTKLQWELWRKVKADHCGMEVHSVVGNHDVWGWAKSKAGTTGTEPLYGKRWVCDEFGRDLPYTSFDRAGWHIVLLDSIFPHPELGGASYIGRIDDAQWDWLERDLAAVGSETPIVIFSHIPILSATPIVWAGPATPQTASIQLPGELVHVDGDRFQKLFATRRNVKACASGHMHLIEQLDYDGVRYLCNGAVSAGWWKGKNRNTDFGYGVIDLFDDGTVARHYVPYGWTAAT